MIKMSDGSSVKIEQASLNIFKEKELCSGPCHIREDGSFIRDAVGVIEEHIWNNGSCTYGRKIVNSDLRFNLHAHNDTQPKEHGYKNTPEACRARSREMARWLMHKFKWPSY